MKTVSTGEGWMEESN